MKKKKRKEKAPNTEPLNHFKKFSKLEFKKDEFTAWKLIQGWDRNTLHILNYNVAGILGN